VAGERRVRAAAIAGLLQVRAIVKDLSDDEVLEIQLSENLNRENPHPLREAFAILRMQQNGKPFEDICKRLAKSKSFVYQRLKLSQLDAGFQGVFLANKIGTALALKLAELSPLSQQKIYEGHFEAWNDDDFEVPDYLGSVIQNLRFDLHEANFSIRSKSLIPEAGACTHCSYNSAAVASLFPELAKKAVCSNAACFEQKALAHYHNLFTKALEKEKPEALIINNGMDELLPKLLDNCETAQSLPVYNYYDVSVLNDPEQPTPEDYEVEIGEEGDPQFDKAGFEQAVAEYNDELKEIEKAKQSGELKKALHLKYKEVKTVWFVERTQSTGVQPKQKVTAKAVQEAIKAGVATTELLQAEITRIEEREKRAKELDREKVQEAVHELFIHQMLGEQQRSLLTDGDKVAAKLLYHSMDYQAREIFDKTVLKDVNLFRSSPPEVFTRFHNMTTEEQLFLIRTALAHRSKSKRPDHINGFCLYWIANITKMDILPIEQEQHSC